MEGLNELLYHLMNYDFNQDGILSFREILTFLADHFNHIPIITPLPAYLEP